MAIKPATIVNTKENGLCVLKTIYLSKVIDKIRQFMNSPIHSFISKHLKANGFSTQFKQLSDILQAPVSWYA